MKLINRIRVPRSIGSQTIDTCWKPKFLDNDSFVPMHDFRTNVLK